MGFLDLLGHGGYVLLLLGQLGVARGAPAGWLLRAAGELVWLWIGWQLGLSSIVLWGAVFIFVEGYGYHCSNRRHHR